MNIEEVLDLIYRMAKMKGLPVEKDIPGLNVDFFWRNVCVLSGPSCNLGFRGFGKHPIFKDTNIFWLARAPKDGKWIEIWGRESFMGFSGLKIKEEHLHSFRCFPPISDKDIHRILGIWGISELDYILMYGDHSDHDR